MWYGCSVTCGKGHKSRQRYCSNPAPSDGGSACMGLSTEQVACNVVSCPGMLTRSNNIVSSQFRQLCVFMYGVDD